MLIISLWVYKAEDGATRVLVPLWAAVSNHITYTGMLGAGRKSESPKV